MLNELTESIFLCTTQSCIVVCMTKNIKISVLKSELSLKIFEFFGRQIDSEGVQNDPETLSGIQNVH